MECGSLLLLSLYCALCADACLGLVGVHSLLNFFSSLRAFAYGACPDPVGAPLRYLSPPLLCPCFFEIPSLSSPSTARIHTVRWWPGFSPRLQRFPRASQKSLTAHLVFSCT